MTVGNAPCLLDSEQRTDLMDKEEADYLGTLYERQCDSDERMVIIVVTRIII